ncbi:hypothetical protein EIP91_012341 [Steccherinum ochraceum]|uniref:Uncharacterized protein n=1 Tax=Steccherinum ochraceum TaxID=92696 RepID=A0A4R0RGF5_9APHY|nr:hypothetical protein EIP91_012341 [Steccherinum ochraceum]
MFKLLTTTILALAVTLTGAAPVETRAAPVEARDYNMCPTTSVGVAIADLGNQNYIIYDETCKELERPSYNSSVNVCMIDKFKCSPEPVTITDVFYQAWYTGCKANSADHPAGNCNGQALTYCC